MEKRRKEGRREMEQEINKERRNGKGGKEEINK